MTYTAEMAQRAKEQLDAFVCYLVWDLQNPQAASGPPDDAMAAAESFA